MENHVPFSKVGTVIEQLKHAPFLCKLEEAYDNELHITIMSATTGGFADAHGSTDACQLDDGTFYPGEWKHYGILFHLE